MYCDKCQKSPEEIRSETRTETYTVFGEPIDWTGRLLICPECGTVVSDEETDDRILREVYAEYRRRKGFMTPEEIAALRRHYGFEDPEDFAVALGLERWQIASYENGGLQSPKVEKILRAVAEHPWIMAFYVRASMLPDAKKEKVLRVIAESGEDMDTDRMVGESEIAKIFGWSRSQAHNYYRFGISDFPEPDFRLANGPVWRLATIEKWAHEKHGRR